MSALGTMPAGDVIAGPAFALPDLEQAPDERSFRQRLGLLLPATNTTLEHDLWSLIIRNQHLEQLQGVGLHATAVASPAHALRNARDRERYGRLFLAGLAAAADTALMAQPHRLILGMSLEHVVSGLEAIRAPANGLRSRTGLPCTSWDEAVAAALERLGVRRIALLTPFDRDGTDSAAGMFRALGYEVVAALALACTDARHIARVPQWAKENAVYALLAASGGRADALVQCGTNMSMLETAERLEPRTGVPILGINPVLLWHALRESGVSAPLAGGGLLLRR